MPFSLRCHMFFLEPLFWWIRLARWSSCGIVCRWGLGFKDFINVSLGRVWISPFWVQLGLDWWSWGRRGESEPISLGHMLPSIILGWITKLRRAVSFSAAHAFSSLAGGEITAIILLVIDQSHYVFCFSGDADICTPSNIKCVDKALGKQAFFIFANALEYNTSGGSGHE